MKVNKGILIFFLFFIAMGVSIPVAQSYDSGTLPLICFGIFVIAFIFISLFMFVFLAGIAIIEGLKWNDLIKAVFLKEK